MIFPPAIYDKVKFGVLTVLPAIATLYFTLGSIYDLPAVEQVMATCTALATFLGALIGVSAKNYNKSDEKFDGDAVFSENEDGTQTAQYVFKEYPPDLAAKDELVLKVRNEAPQP